MGERITRLLPLDTLRGIAAIGVAFFWHYQGFSPDEYPFSQKGYWFYHYGWTCVDFFFILSGFVFSYVYKERILKQELLFKDYIILRMSRLYPVFLMTLCVVAIMQWMRIFLGMGFFCHPYNDIYHFILNLFFLQDGWFEYGFSFNAPSWSVACEVVAYILFFVILKKSIASSKYQYVGYLLLILVGMTIKKIGIDVPLFNMSMARVFIAFFTGTFLYEMNEKLKKVDLAEQRTIKYSLLGIFLVLVSATSSYGHAILGIQWDTVYVLLIYPLVIMLVLNFRIINRILSLKIFTYLGDISYSIYLWHFPVQLFLVTLNDFSIITVNFSDRKMFFMYIILTLFVSVISNELYEKKLRKWIRKKYL